MTGYADWDPALATGDLEVDAQHIALFSLVDQMHTLVAEGHGQEAIDESIDAIVQFAHSHFDYEEILMERAGYPALPSQIQQHRQFTDQIDELRCELVCGENVSPLGVVEYMHSWLTDHIGREDRKIGEFIRSLSA